MKLTREIVMNCRNDEDNIFYIPDEYEKDFLNILIKSTTLVNAIRISDKPDMNYLTNSYKISLTSSLNVYPLFPNSRYECCNRTYYIY